MKITRVKNHCDWRPLNRFPAGSVVRFLNPFSKNERDDDVYLALSVCSSYAPYNPPHADNFGQCQKIGVANLRTGNLSFVAPTRNACEVAAEVMIDGQ